MPYSYNPLLAAKLDKEKKNLNELNDVNTAGTINGKVLTYQSGTWLPEAAAGGGDMLKSVYDTNDDGVVDNSERLEGDTLATVQAHNVDASKITTGTFGLARIPAVDDARIPNLETLSYGGAFAAGQVPSLPASKITSGTFNVNRIETLANLKGTVTAEKVAALPASKTTTGTFNLNRIPSVDDARIPDLETLSYGAAFATAQIPAIGAYKISSGTLGLARIPSIDDVRIPDLDTLSYSAAFADAQIPNLAASKITTGTFNVNRIETLANLKGTVTAEKVAALGASKITSGTFGLARIPSITNAYIAGDITSDKIPALPGTAVAYPLNADTVGTTAIKAAGVGNDELPASGLDIEKFTVGTAGVARIPSLPTARITSGTFGLARIPAVDDARIPDLETLSYGAAFAGAQIPNLPTSKITSGTFDDARVPDTGVVAINFIIDGAGAAITEGTVGFLEVPFACHVDRWTLLADQHGSVVIDIWRDAYSNYPPTDADSMSGTTNMPAISGTIAAQGTDLSGWGTQGIASGDILAYHVDSCSSIELCTIALRVQKT